VAAHRMHNEYLNVLYDAERQNLIKRRGVDALLLATYAEEVLPHLCILCVCLDIWVADALRWSCLSFDFVQRWPICIRAEIRLACWR
jgi:hypothetical protein